MKFFKKSIFICLFALLYSSTSGVLADQLTVDIPSVDVSVTKDAEGYAKFEFSDPERGSVQFISRTGEPAIPYLILPALFPPGADLSTLEVEIRREAVTSEAVQTQEEWEIRKIPSPSTWSGSHHFG